MEATVAEQSAELVEFERHTISQIYLFLARCFTYPAKEFYEAMKGIETTEEMNYLVEGLPFNVDFKGIPSPSLSQDDFENEYVNTFDINPSRPLYETAYSREDMCSREVYEDLLRFYEHFDIKLSEKEKDFPDHIAAELEFMVFLAKKEADALECGKDANPYRFAQLDFLERHLGKWMHKLDEKIQKKVKEHFYKEASAFMVEFLDSHILYLRKILTPEASGLKKSS